MRVATGAMLFVCCVVGASDTGNHERRPALASSASPWNVLAYGGKGEMDGAPICHSISYFSKSPLPLDFDADFFGAKKADLITHAKVNLVGVIAAQRVYEVKQTVTRRDDQPGRAGSSVPPTMKVLMVERRPGEFCDIYQNQYTYDPTRETDEAIILEISGREVLKTYETDQHTWYLAYWAIENHEPLRLNPDDLYAAIRSASPPGALPFTGALNLTGSHFTVDILGQSSEQDLLGKVRLQLGVDGNKIVTLSKTWVPAGAGNGR